MAANCGWPQHGLKHLLSIFWDYNIFESFIFLRKSCLCDKDTQCASLRDVICVQRLADVANIWERLPRNSDHKLHTPEYWVIFEGGGSTIDPAIIWYLASFKKKRRKKQHFVLWLCEVGEGDLTINNKILCKLGEKWSQSSTRFKVLPEQRGFQLSIISGIQIGKRVLTGPPGIPIAAFFSHSSKRQNQPVFKPKWKR